MKKNYFMLAATTMMFAACAQTDVVNEIATEETPQAIGFETFANKVTRSSRDTNLEKYHTTFGVWAYKTPTGGSESNVMSNYQVKHDDINGSGTHGWSYDGDGVDANQVLKYWDKLAAYKFYAYSPYNENVKIDATNKYISIPSGVYAANQNLQTWATVLNNDVFTTSIDWMIADEVTRDAGNNDLVTEEFKHTMSKLVVKLQSTVANTIVKSVSINNVHGTGSYTTETNAWTAHGPATSISGATGIIADKDKEYYSMEYLLIPSEDDPTFSITYEVNGDEFTVNGASISAITEFEENTCYTLTVKIDLSAIHFDATVDDFTFSSTPGLEIK